jgi:hypothetical protein
MEGLIDLQAVQEEKKKDEIEFPENGTSLDLLRAIYRCVTLPLNTRMRAAGMALQFEHPKLGVSLNFPWNGDLADQLTRAVERSGTVMKMIDHQPTKISEQPSSPCGPITLKKIDCEARKAVRRVIPP